MLAYPRKLQERLLGLCTKRQKAVPDGQEIEHGPRGDHSDNYYDLSKALVHVPVSLNK